MLEAIRERSQGWLAKVVLGLITIPFALWGVDSYIGHGGDGDYVAIVGGNKITPQDFDQALKQQQEKLRGVLGASFDPAIMDSPEVRNSVLDNLINQRLLAAQAIHSGLTISDERLYAVIAGEPSFQEDGKFSKSLYERLLRQQNMTPATFQTRVREDLLVQQLRNSYTESVFVPHRVVGNFVKLIEQQREVSQLSITPASYLAQVKLDPAAIKTYYENHRSDYTIPEQVRLEYVVLSVDRLMPEMSVTNDEIKKYYAEHTTQFGEPEQRQASHILINAAPTASAAERDAAKARAEQVLKLAKQNPASFSELAKQHSQDPGSAQKGGDLGMLGRGALVQPFEDAEYQLKVGEISGLVQSEFGFHIIKLIAIQPAKIKALPDVQTEIAQELKKQKASKKFVELAETFNTTVYEQSDSLKPVSDALKLPLQTSAWMGRKGGEPPLLNHGRLMQAVFSEDVLKNKRNTEAIEAAPNTLVAARVIEHKPASVKSLQEVSAQIAAKLQREQANALAIREGKEKLAKLRQGTAIEMPWSAPQMISRQRPEKLSEATVATLFKAETNKLPAYVGVEDPQGGYILAKISRVIEAPEADVEKAKGYSENLQQLVAQESFMAYLASLKQGAEIKIKKENLEKKER